MRRPLPLLAAALVLGLAAPSAASAQPATPPADAPVPPAECRVAPRDRDVADLAGEPAPSPVVPRPEGRVIAPRTTLAALPDGTPADADTVAEVAATLRQLAACGNAGFADDLENDARVRLGDQILALHTEDYFRRNAEADVTQLPPPEDRGEAVLRLVGLSPTRYVSFGYSTLGFGPDAPTPTIERAWALPDGRVVAVVRPRWAGRLVVVLARDEQTRRLLVDEFANVADDAGTPTS